MIYGLRFPSADILYSDTKMYKNGVKISQAMHAKSNKSVFLFCFIQIVIQISFFSELIYFFVELSDHAVCLVKTISENFLRFLKKYGKSMDPLYTPDIFLNPRDCRFLLF